MGIALLGSVMNAAYAPGLSRLHEEGVPAAAGSAAARSLGEAYQVAGQLGGPAGHVLRTTARHAFVDGLHVTLLVSAGLLLLGALAALRLPRVMDCGQETEGREALGPAAAPEWEASRADGPDRSRQEARTLPAQGGPGRRHRAVGRREVAEATGPGRAGR